MSGNTRVVDTFASRLMGRTIYVGDPVDPLVETRRKLAMTELPPYLNEWGDHPDRLGKQTVLREHARMLDEMETPQYPTDPRETLKKLAEPDDGWR